MVHRDKGYRFPFASIRVRHQLTRPLADNSRSSGGSTRCLFTNGYEWEKNFFFDLINEIKDGSRENARK